LEGRDSTTELLPRGRVAAYRVRKSRALAR
jgi:hypothetical protein